MEQTENGDKFWGIDIAEKRRIERLRKQVQEKLCMWREMGEEMRIQDSVRERNQSVSFRKKYMSNFWKSPVLVQDDNKSQRVSNVSTKSTNLLGTTTSFDMSVTTPSKEKQHLFFVQKKTSPRRRHV